MTISLSLLLPILFATIIALSGTLPSGQQEHLRRIVAIIAPTAVLPAILLAITGPGTELEVPWFLFGISLSVDELARPLMLVGALLYGVGLIAISWTKRNNTEHAASVLAGFLLTCYTGNIGVYLADDVVSFYLFFTLMSFSAIGLVVHYRTARAYRATRLYVTMTVVSETALLGGLFFTVQAGGVALVDAPDAIVASPSTGLILTLLFIGFGIKAGMVPLHMWLPVAYAASPPAAAAVLSGAMSKAGLVGILRFFPLETAPPAADTAATIDLFGWVLMALAIIGTFGAVVIGMLQRNPLAVLAYSSISQMGFMGIVVAAGILNSDMAKDALDATVLYAVHHGLVKAALFLGVAVVYRCGSGVIALMTSIGMAAAGLALAGAPLTSGGIAKYVSKEAVGTFTVAGIGLEYILPLVATGSIVLLARLLWVVRPDRQQSSGTVVGQFLAWFGIVIAGGFVPWIVSESWSPLQPPDWTDPMTLWDASWPIGAGLVLVSVAWWMAQRGWFGTRQGQAALVPAGDLVVVAEGAAHALQTTGADRLDRVHDLATKTRTGTHRMVSTAMRTLRSRLARLEGQAGQWPIFGAVAVVLLTTIVVISLLVGIGA